MAFRNPLNRITFPDGAGTGTMRLVVGADTPPELVAFGIKVAIIWYQVDKNTNIEVGYHWIGSSNVFDAFGDARTLSIGNVTYPTPGVPTSATQNDVHTNIDFDMFAQYPQTTIKDQRMAFWSAIDLEPQNGFQYFRYAGADIRMNVDTQIARNSANQNITGVHLLAGTLVNVNAPRVNTEFLVRAAFDFSHVAVAASPLVVGELIVDGASVTGQAIFGSVGGGAIGTRITAFQQWFVNMAASGAHTFQLRVSNAGTAGAVTVSATHTTMTVQLLKKAP